MARVVATSEPALFRRWPALRGRTPWLSIGTYSTPVEPLHPLAQEMFGAELWVKRDDLSAPRYGGNKVRKLEFILADARQRRARRLITVGAVGSHHAFATALYGREHGFAVTLALFPQRRTEHVRRVLLMDQAVGADLRFVRRMELVPAALWALRFAHYRDRPLVVPPGGTSPVGALGYVSAALELAEQIADGGVPEPDFIHVAAGTLGTAAGIAIGLEAAGLRSRVRAIRVTPRIVTNERVLRALIRQTLELLRRTGADVPPLERVMSRIALVHDHVGSGYGHETIEGRQAAEALSRAGLALDPTYTAKTAAGLLHELRARPRGTHLFWHTLSAAEPSDLLEAAQPARLPTAFRRYLDAPAAPGE